VELRQHLDCALTVHFRGEQIACFEQAKGFPLKIGFFVPAPEDPIEIDFIPDLSSLEISRRVGWRECFHKQST
jgi:hypothetical protein